MATTEKANVDVTINGQQAKAEIDELKKRYKELFELKKKAEAAGDVQAWKQIDGEMKRNAITTKKLERNYAELENTLKDLNGVSFNDLSRAKTALLSKLKNLKQGTKEWIETNNDLQKVKSKITDVEKAMGSVQTPLQKVIGFAKGLLPAFGFAAIAAGAKEAFNQVVNSTDTLSTQWAVFMGGLREATNEFWRTLASGNWENFFSNMRSAIEVGRKYERVLDEIEAKQRGLSKAEADARMEMRELEDIVRNVSLSNDERVDAAEKRIKLEEKLTKQRTELAQKEYQNELNLAMQASKLDEKRLMEQIDAKSVETELHAKTLTELRERYAALEKANQVVVGGVRVNGPSTPEMQQLKTEMSKYPAFIAEYANNMEKIGNVTDDQLNKLIAAYEKVKAAEASALENTKRVRSAMYSIFDEDNRKKDAGSGSVNKEVETTTAALENSYKEQLLLLKQYYANKQHLQEEANARELALELAHLKALAEATIDEKKKLDILLKIAEAQEKFNKAMENAVPEMIKNEQHGDKLNTRLLEYSKLAEYAAKKQHEGTTAMAEFSAEQQQQAQAILAYGNILTDYITGALDGTANSYQSFGQTLILMSLQMLKQMVPIWSAQILGYSLASPESVASWGVAGVAKFTAISALMYAAIAAAEGAVKRSINNKSEAAGKKAYGAGKYPGLQTGMYGDQPHMAIFNEVPGFPEMVVDGITTRRIQFNHPEIMDAIYRIRDGRQPQYAEGKFPANPVPITTNQITTTTDPEIKKLLAANINAINKFMEWKPKVYTEDIKKGLDNLSDIERKRGM